MAIKSALVKILWHNLK